MLPVLAQLNPEIAEIQAVIIAPTRELAIQIEQVLRDMGTGIQDQCSLRRPQRLSRPKRYGNQTCYLGRHTRQSSRPSCGREAFDTTYITILVLVDEFDKSLEIGFEGEMIEILDSLPQLKKKILTSATQEFKVPPFVGLNNPGRVNYLHEEVKKLEVKQITVGNDLLEGLADSLKAIGNKPGIIFCNYKDTIASISDLSERKEASHTGTIFLVDWSKKTENVPSSNLEMALTQLLLATRLGCQRHRRA